jgi:para-aminobenzoate synthetase component 1
LPPFQGGWIGWFGYELGTAFDRIERHRSEPHPVPDIALGLHDWVIAWDHRRNQGWLISSGIDAEGHADPARARDRARSVLDRLSPPSMATAQNDLQRPASSSFAADFTEAEYRTAVARAIELILDGDLFQVNLAQRFTTEFLGDPLAFYRALCLETAAPMAAFIRHGAASIASASPEEFLRLDPRTRQVETRPIKGTRPRSADSERDAALSRALTESAKDRAENVMIVDLLRNDLSKVCVPGTVAVPTLCAAEAHPTVHHLVSIVTGELRHGPDALDLLAATFPGGSITGAPKLRAMEIIATLEPTARGVYSGAIGWIGFDGGMNMSIAIRTVVMHDGVATLHVGGGITARSDPGEEYQETLDKAGALFTAMGNVR